MSRIAHDAPMWWLNFGYLRGRTGHIRVGQLILAYLVLGAHVVLAAVRTLLGVPLLALGLLFRRRI